MGIIVEIIEGPQRLQLALEEGDQGKIYLGLKKIRRRL